MIFLLQSKHNLQGNLKVFCLLLALSLFFLVGKLKSDFIVSLLPLNAQSVIRPVPLDWRDDLDSHLLS